MKKIELDVLVDSKQKELDEKGIININAYDVIKQEYMEGQHGKITKRQLGNICDKALRKGRGWS